MNYEVPTISMGASSRDGVTPYCTPGLAVAVAVAGVVWNVGGIYSYAGVAVAAVVAGVSFLVVGTGCWPD